MVTLPGFRRLLDDAGKAQLADAVTAAEARTGAEMLVVVMRASAPYNGLAQFLGFLGGSAVLIGGSALMGEGVVAAAIGDNVVPVMGGLFALIFFGVWLGLRFLLPRLTPARWRHAWASKSARREFSRLKSLQRQDEPALLIFLSEVERHFEILVDQTVARSVSDAYWQDIVTTATTRLRKSTGPMPLVNAVAQCGDILAPRFPARPIESEPASDAVR